MICASGSPAPPQDRGMQIDVDRCGNQWAWWGDPDACPGGGHRQPPGLRSRRRRLRRAAGGGLGVRRCRCHASGGRSTPARPLGVVNFSDEEGARFGIACAGSRLLTGALAPDRALALVDADGVTLAQALTAAGRPTDVGMDRPVLRPSRHLRRTACRAGTRARRPAPGYRGRLAPSGRTVGSGSSFPVRRTMPARPGWPTVATR